MADTTNFYGTDGDDLIDFSKRPLSQLSYSVGRAGKGNDTIYLTSGKWAVGGAGDDTITSIGYGMFGVKYDESTKGISLDALKGTVQDGYGNVDTIRGINAFFGSAYDDLFLGSTANEYFGSWAYDPSGNDSYIGGGGYDIVLYFSKSTDYQVSINANDDSATVKYLKTGSTDYLKGISQIQFRDLNVSLQTHTAAHELVYGSDSNELFKAGSSVYYPLKGGDTIKGMGGFDVVTYPSVAADYEVKVDASADSATVKWLKSGGTDTLQGISRIDFVNTSITLSMHRPAKETISGTAGNDLLTSTATRANTSSGGDLFIGGGGYDSVYYADFGKNFKVSFDASKNIAKVTWSDGSTDILENIARIQFKDSALDLGKQSPTLQDLSGRKISDWTQYKANLDFMQKGLGGRPVGFNLDKIWYNNFQVPFSKFSLSSYQTHVDASVSIVVGYGTSVVRNDGSLLVVSSGWDPGIGANGRLATAVIKDGVLQSANYQAIEGATHSYVLEDPAGARFILFLGVDEGKLDLLTTSDGAITDVLSGQANAPSILFDINALTFVQRSDLIFSSHGNQSIDFNGDGRTDILSMAFNLPTKNGIPFLLINNGAGDFTIKEIGFKNGANQLASMSIGWLGKQANDTYAIALGDPNFAGQTGLEGERNYVVYLNANLDTIVGYQKLPIPIFEDPVYKGIPLAYPNWVGNVGTSHDPCIRTIDVNGDGRLDIVIGEKIAALNNAQGYDSSFGSLQILIDQGNGQFADETASRLYGFLTTFAGVHNFDFKDINGDGFLDILMEDYGLPSMANPGNWPMDLWHPFYVLENDGLGHYINVVHAQIGLLGSNSAKTQFALDAQGRPVWVQWAPTSEANVAEVKILQTTEKLSTGPNLDNPALQGAPGFNEFYYLLSNPDVQKLVSNSAYASGLAHFLALGKDQGRMAFAPNAWVQGSPANDTIILREGNEKAFGQEGNDTVFGGAGNDTIDGGVGTDTVRYSGNRANFKLAFAEIGVTVSSGTDGVDTLTNIERIKFSDVNVALDLGATQAAGQTSLLLGAVLPGKLALDASKQALLGSGIGLFDAGYSMPVLSGALLRLDIWSVLTGQNVQPTYRTLAEDTAIVNYLMTNVNGITPDATSLKANADAMHSESSQGEWLAQLALSHAGQSHIGLIGLASTGIAYT